MSDCVVITGASGALGGAVARALAERGRGVAPIASRDLASAEAARRALGEIEARLGPPAGAVLAAGAWRGGRPFHEAPEEEWTAMLGANLETARRALGALLPGMVARGRGSVVVIGSRAAADPATAAGAAAYAASKAAVVALAQAIAAEVRDRGVRVNAVLPSTIDTPANRAAMPGADFGKWVSLASLVEVIAFLLSEASRDISGAAIPVYGRA